MVEVGQFFSKFKGLDTSSSDLSRSPDAAKQSINIEIDRNYALVGRAGCSIAYQEYLGTTIANGKVPIGVHTYYYRDPLTNESREEMLVIADKIYRVKTANLNITNASAFTVSGNYTAHASPLKGTYTLVIDPAVGDSYTGVYTFGSDLLASNTTLSQLATAVTASSCTAVLTVPSEVSGLSVFGIGVRQSGEYAATTNLDIPIFYLEEIPVAPTFSYARVVEASPPPDYTLTTLSEDLGVLIDLNYEKYVNDRTLPLPCFYNHNDCCYITLGSGLPMLKYDGVVISESGVFPVSPFISSLIESSDVGALTGTYRYYVRNKAIDGQGNILFGAGQYFSKTVTSKAIKLKSSNFAQYGGRIAYNSPSAIEAYGYENIAIGEIVNGETVTSVDFENQLATLDVSGSTALSDCYKQVFTNSYQGFGFRINDTQIEVEDAVAGIVAGQSVFFSTASDKYNVQTTKVISVEAIGSSTYFSGTGVVITFSNPVGEGLSSGDEVFFATQVMEVYRTENGGVTKFYKVLDTIGDFASGAYYYSFIDETLDTALGAEFTPPINEPDNLKQPPTLVSAHQGVLITAGFKRFPNRVFFESVEFRESYPLTSNFIDVTMQEAGLITAVWSDNQDSLAVFKPSSYYVVRGDFTATPAFLVQDKIDESFGVSGQNSLTKFLNMSVGYGRQGWIFFSAEKIFRELALPMEAESGIVNRQYLQLAGAFTSQGYVSYAKSIDAKGVRSFADYRKQKIFFYCPSVLGSYQGDEIFTFDYSENAWGKMGFYETAENGEQLVTRNLGRSSFMPSAGFCEYQNEIYFASSPIFINESTDVGSNVTDYRLYTRIFKLNNRDLLPYLKATSGGSFLVKTNADLYSDCGVKIPYVYVGQWAYLDSPSVEKSFAWLKVYSFSEKTSNTGFVPFTLYVDFYKNWDDSTPFQTLSASYSTSSDKERIFKLKGVKARALLCKFRVSTVGQCPIITGYELGAESTYKLEQLK